MSTNSFWTAVYMHVNLTTNTVPKHVFQSLPKYNHHTDELPNWSNSVPWEPRKERMSAQWREQASDAFPTAACISSAWVLWCDYIEPYAPGISIGPSWVFPSERMKLFLQEELKSFLPYYCKALRCYSNERIYW